MTSGFACFLLRDKLIPLLEALQFILPGASLHEDNEHKPNSRFVELLKETVRFETHTEDWCFHAIRDEQDVLPLFKMARRDDFSYLDLCDYVEKLSQQYSWCLIPWGVSGTGLMIAFVSSDEEIFKKILKWLGGTASGLFVSSYTIERVRERRFRGAIFGCPGNSSAGALWEYGRGSYESVLALTIRRADSTAANVETICAAPLGDRFSLVSPTWLRIVDEASFERYVSDHLTEIITPPGLDEKIMWLALQDFAGVDDYINRDRLSFGIKALESVSWMYIPKYDDHHHWEIYINKDPVVTSRLLKSEKLTCTERFMHKYFC